MLLSDANESIYMEISISPANNSRLNEMNESPSRTRDDRSNQMIMDTFSYETEIEKQYPFGPNVCDNK